ncbi:GTPase-associated protein 1-related protein [Nocardiopsis algeriensis]|uniref:GTPase-associated protein 1-related protein n=1 Tax=Nocardiopsis algeriensis TaxID=1478215 RepID=UPI003B43B1CD
MTRPSQIRPKDTPMGYAQLYYTSCERGLSGYAGYQFNAATPGVDPRVLREVERFTVYEPPRTLAPDRVEEHPVNLCYSPDLGGVPVLSRVVSCGDDPSGRPGNYFVHSLVGACGPLPAELWGADFWVSAPVAAPDLPDLRVGGGPLDRSRTHAWLHRRPPELVAALLAAADGAVGGGRPLVLVAGSEAVAHWVAALAHLLPPGRARALSFATYSADPDETPVHVVGVAPGTDTDTLRGRFTVVDPESASADTLPRPSAEAWAVATRLVRTGPVKAADLWRACARHASGRESSLSDWYPVLAATALRGGAEQDPQEVRAVRAWLAEAVERLAPADTAALVSRILDTGSSELDDRALADLQKVAHRAGSAQVTERLERMLARRSLDAVAAGTAAPPVAPMRSEPVRTAVRGRISALLEDTRGPLRPERVVELLDWARAGGLVPPAVSLERYGRDTVAPLLAAAPGAVPSPAVAALLGTHPEMRRGAAERLCALPRERLAVLAAGPAGALFSGDRGGSGALLRELRLLDTDDRSDPVRLLAAVMAVRGEGRAAGAPGIAGHDLDADLLVRVWGPGHGPRAALLTLRGLRPGPRVCPGAGEWVARALVAVPPPGGERDWHELVEEVSRHWMGDRLPEEALGVVGDWAMVASQLAEVRRSGTEHGPRLLEPVYRVLPGVHPAAAEMARRTVADLLLNWDDPLRVAEALRECPDGVFSAYRSAAAVRLEGENPDTGTAARVYRVARLVGEDGGRALSLEREVLSPALATWRRRHVAGVRRKLPREEAAGFDTWVQEWRAPSGHLFSRWVGRRV